MKLFVILILSFLVSCSCATSSPEIFKIRAHKQYKNMSSAERDLTEDIMDKAIDSDRKNYYFSKLNLLLNTESNSPEDIREMNRREVDRSVKNSKKERRKIIKQSDVGLEEYLSREEFYESVIDRKWKTYSPNFNGTFFYIVDEDPLDILVHIKVKLHGDYDLVVKVILLEDSIEKHLNIPGYSVNLVFVGYSSDEDDVFNVDVDPKKWTTSHNWIGDYKGLAHELLHLMGLPDEYDRIEVHANNRNMTKLSRLYQFIIQMDAEVPLDSVKGIMHFHKYRPLERHVCASVGLGKECIRVRSNAFRAKD